MLDNIDTGLVFGKGINMVRPIERQESILQSSITERMQQIQQQHPDIQKRHFELLLSQEHRKKLQTITESEENEPLHFKEEGEKRQRDEHRRGPDARAGSPQELSSEQAEHGHIDIKI